MVTAIGAVFCVIATLAFWRGFYWIGLATGLFMMVLDTVDGKLARCTITSSWWGNVFDHGMDLIHPPFWWYAWGAGLVPYGRPLADTTFAWCMAAILGGYVVQRLIEGAFIQLFGIHIHVWRRFDSRFRLVTARRTRTCRSSPPSSRSAGPTGAWWRWRSGRSPRSASTSSSFSRRWSRARGDARSGAAGVSGWTAILLAGQRPGTDPLAGALRRALEGQGAGRGRGDAVARRATLLASPSVARVVVLAQEPDALLAADCVAGGGAAPVDRRLLERHRHQRRRGGGSAAAPWPVLVTTADHPLLTPAMIEAAIAGLGAADVGVGVVGARVLLAAYPDNRRTWLRFRGERWSGANLFALGNARAAAALAAWSAVERDRKKALKLIWHFGPLLALGALTRTITLETALAKAGRAPRLRGPPDPPPLRRGRHRRRQAERPRAGGADPGGAEIVSPFAPSEVEGRCRAQPRPFPRCSSRFARTCVSTSLDANGSGYTERSYTGALSPPFAASRWV